MPVLELLATLRLMSAAHWSRLRRGEEGVTTTEVAVIVGALVILAATAAAVIASKVMAKVNSIQL